MKLWIPLIISLVFTVSCSEEEGDKTEQQAQLTQVTQKFKNQFGNKVIYGEDDRRDVFEEPNADLRMLAASTVALIRNSKLTVMGDDFALNTTPYSSRNLCRNEPFYEQDTAAFCSGFLVAPNLVVTAGHCIRSQADCNSTSFAFDFAIKEEGSLVPTTLAGDNVYHCGQVIDTQLRGSDKQDYAVIKLDREVVGRTPLNIRREGQVEMGSPLVVIGHPSGLPTKVANGGNVLEQHGTYFTADLDTYGGNSGSAVFNRETLEVEGILVRGARDFVYDSANSCTRSNECAGGVLSQGCGGEEVTRITALVSSIPAK